MITPDEWAGLEQATVAQIRGLDPAIDAFIGAILPAVVKTNSRPLMFGVALILGSVLADAILSDDGQGPDLEERLKIFCQVARQSYTETIEHANQTEAYGHRH